MTVKQRGWTTRSSCGWLKRARSAPGSFTSATSVQKRDNCDSTTRNHMKQQILFIQGGGEGAYQEDGKLVTYL
jgi:hypothetical protein